MELENVKHLLDFLPDTGEISLRAVVAPEEGACYVHTVGVISTAGGTSQEQKCIEHLSGYVYSEHKLPNIAMEGDCIIYSYVSDSAGTSVISVRGEALRQMIAGANSPAHEDEALGEDA